MINKNLYILVVFCFTFFGCSQYMLHSEYVTENRKIDDCYSQILFKSDSSFMFYTRSGLSEKCTKGEFQRKGNIVFLSTNPKYIENIYKTSDSICIRLFLRDLQDKGIDEFSVEIHCSNGINKNFYTRKGQIQLSKAQINSEQMRSLTISSILTKGISFDIDSNVSGYDIYAFSTFSNNDMYFDNQVINVRRNKVKFLYSGFNKVVLNAAFKAQIKIKNGH